jgi:NAD(P)-dependent dehydrogenase (short-subunit alcohol dehydrogenase family)
MKNYLIIGGSSGIGLATVELLLAAGNQVFATYFSKEKPNNKANYIKLNVLDDSYDLSFLPEKLDGLVYCPGNINLKPFGRFKAQDFVDDYQLQVVGAVKVIQAVLPLLKKSEDASIVLFSTVAVLAFTA